MRKTILSIIGSIVIIVLAIIIFKAMENSKKAIALRQQLNFF